MDDQIIRLEERLAYQDKLIADLDEVVRSLHQRLDLFERRVSSISESLRNMAEDVGPADEKPPHY